MKEKREALLMKLHFLGISSNLYVILLWSNKIVYRLQGEHVVLYLNKIIFLIRKTNYRVKYSFRETVERT